MKIVEQVTNILKYSHAARNSDKELLIIYMQKFGMRLSDNQIATFRKMPSVETIRRTRQMIQERGIYPADESVDTVRFEKYQATRQNIKGDVDPEDLLEQQGYKVLPWGS